MRKITYIVNMNGTEVEVATYKKALEMKEKFDAEFEPKLTEFEFDPIITVKVSCSTCGKTSHVAMKESKWYKWQIAQMNGESPVDIFDNMPASQRKILLEHKCIRCQKKAV